MFDGSPQMTETRVDTDGEQCVIDQHGSDALEGEEHRARPVRRRGAVCTLSDPSRYYAIRGRVVKTTTEGGAAHIDALAALHPVARTAGTAAAIRVPGDPDHRRRQDSRHGSVRLTAHDPRSPAALSVVNGI